MCNKIAIMITCGGVRRISGLAAVAFVLSLRLSAQIAIEGVTVSATQAILQYTSPVSDPCSLQVADMNRGISIASVAQSNGSVTVQTAAPHGLLAGAVIYLGNSGAWNGWQVLTSVPSTTSFVFANAASGGASGGNAGVLIDDVNPALFSGGNLDSRAGSISTGQTTGPGHTNPPSQDGGRSRTFVIGKRSADVALDGNRYSRALQAFSRHHFTLTCGPQTFDQDFRTANIPLGDTYDDGPPADPANPGSYSYPTIQWSNKAQALIDPLSGVLSRRVTGPTGAASAKTAFGTAIDVQGSAWTKPQQALSNSSGAASFTPPCASGTCPLLLRADNLTIFGGASYSFPDSGTSLDWYQVAFTASISNSACAGDDCKVSACLTINGQTCATPAKDQTLSITPVAYTLGTQNLMDLWQASGPPAVSRVDAVEFTGTVNYNAATNTVTWASGDYFDLNWRAGSQITIAGGQFSIASVLNEAALTLVSGPASSFTGAAYSASNFGVLLWKKTATPDTISISSATYLYGSSAFSTWGASATDSCSSSSPVTVGGKAGYNCFVGSELFWIAADGSQANDLGLVQTSYRPTTTYGWGMGYVCGSGSQVGQFDPQNGDVWYCMFPVNYGSNGTSYGTVTQARYMGSHSAYTPGKVIPDCALNSGAQPCIQFTNMMPTWPSIVSNGGPAFNPEIAASGAVLNTNLTQGGIDPTTSTMLIYNFTPVNGVGGGQDWPAWIFMYSLGDRTPTGTDANSFQIVASASTYRHPPLSWCSLHNTADVPYGGWAEVSSNDLTIDGAYGTYNMAFASGQASLSATAGAAGGLNACPSNPFGITGNICTTITVASQPTRQADGATPQNLQVGDVMSIGATNQGGEYLRVLAINSVSPLQFVVQRNYLDYTAAGPGNQSSRSLLMNCGLLNAQGSKLALWNYLGDPYGANANFSTIVTDATLIGGHHYAGTQVNVTAAGAQYNLGVSVCPSALTSACLQVRSGNLYTAQLSPNRGLTTNPQFAGAAGFGTGLGDDGNSVDSHPGPCFGTTCFDARPFDGGYAVGATGSGSLLGTSSSTYTLVTGQLWKISGANNVLHRKILPTFAYVGRNALVDVSGASSSIGTTASSQFTYCYVNNTGECYPGSNVGDVYVNAPYVQFPWCWYPGIAVQPDDVTSICIGDLGGHTANVVQLSATGNDWTGALTRRLGTLFARYNQMHIFWNTIAGPTLSFFGGYARWLDGVRNDALLASLPPMPQGDSISRNTFVPITLNLTPPRGLPLASAVVEFGYAENGSAGAYYCTSRQETCVASSRAVNTSAPFFYEQSEQFSGTPCTTGCSVTVPALPQRVLYYRWKYLSSAGQTIAASAAHAVVTP
jgi:hypothetical protein